MSITFGFAIAFLLCYGDVLASYSTLGTSMVSLYKLMIGSASDTVSMDTSQALGPFFMVSFTALMSLLLLNIFVAVLLKNFLQVEPSPSVVTVVSRQLHKFKVIQSLYCFVQFTCIFTIMLFLLMPQITRESRKDWHESWSLLRRCPVGS